MRSEGKVSTWKARDKQPQKQGVFDRGNTKRKGVGMWNLVAHLDNCKFLVCEPGVQSAN